MELSKSLINRLKLGTYFSTLKGCFRLLNRTDQIKMGLILLAQTFVSFLDLLGVLTLGLLGTIAIQGTMSTPRIPDSDNPFPLSALEKLDFMGSVTTLSVVTILLLVTRLASSFILTRRLLSYFAARAASISADLVLKLLSKSLTDIQKRTIQEITFAVTRGVEIITMQILVGLILLIADLFLLIILVLSLLMVSWQVTLISTVFFGTVGYLLAYFLNNRAKETGKEITKFSIESNERIVEIFSSIRETKVRNRKKYFSREILEIRSALSKSMATYNFMPYIGKHVIEGALVLVTVLLVLYQSLMSGDKGGVGVIAFFLAAASRIAPSILRIQQSILQIKVNIAGANETLQLASELEDKVVESQADPILNFMHEGFMAKVECKQVHFKYPHRKNEVLKDINFSILPGSVVAVVGPSGAGKTTLMDVVLGIVEPTSGEVRISGKSPREAIDQWPGAIAYVPQDISLVRGSIKRNVTLGFNTSEYTDEEVWNSIKKAQLEDFVLSLPEGLDSSIGEVGSRMSGGQRQRLGIARALFTSPKLLVLDEATSALDLETEDSIKRALTKIRGSVTTIIIAHTAGMLRNADIVISLKEGKIFKMGDSSDFQNSGSNLF